METNDIELIKLPTIPLRGVFIFPHMVTHFDAGRAKTIEAIEYALKNGSKVFLATQKDITIEDPVLKDLFTTGTVAEIKQTLRLPGGMMRVLVEGLERGRIYGVGNKKKFIEGEIEKVSTYMDENIGDKETEAVKRLIIKDLNDYMELSEKGIPEALDILSDVSDLDLITDMAAGYMPLKAQDNQSLLSELNIYKRALLFHRILLNEISLLKVEQEITNKVKKSIDKSQKEYYLKEQMKVIQEELGEKSEFEIANKYERKIRDKGLPEEVLNKALEEIERLRRVSESSPENPNIRNYLDWILDLPWSDTEEKEINIKNARKILDTDHYGLEDVKERILEFLAVRSLTKSNKGAILCLMGPPGVGKTSIVRSIARALDKEFVRMALGGVTDEAEIRGHRRTYIGSQPGRIISMMKKAGVKNPVFLFDEIDKIGKDFRGDPASGLLEVLDPEQNSTFMDHYLEVPYDLSAVMFVTTGNYINDIPAPLRDRMEIIEVGSYTELDKLEIAIRHLIPKQLEAHGLKKSNLSITRPAVKKIIEMYTREAGVRGLEKYIATICRKVCMNILENGKKSVRINDNNLSKYLGPEIFKADAMDKIDQIGAVNGLAWTQVGGEILTVEANCFPGKGKIQLTGSLGDVMKESAYAAISYIRAHADELKVESDFHEKTDIHIHVPEGAIPKDGPSAGITIATAVLSALSKRKVHKDIAMTGEITLRGNVLAIGGLKEKLLAAHRFGIKKVLIPIDNLKDLDKIPKPVKDSMKIIGVGSFAEVIEEALVKDDKNEDKK